MTFIEFATELLQPLENTRSKLEQTQRWSEFLKRLSSEQEPASPYLYLSLGQMGPSYASPEFHFGLEFLLTALAEIAPSSFSPNLSDASQKVSMTSLFEDSSEVPNENARQALKKQLKRRYKQLGDVGALAQEILAARIGESQETAPSRSSVELKVSEVFERLLELTTTSGQGSQEEKIRLVAELLKELDPLSARYVSRIILGTLRFGFSDKTLLDAFSWYLAGDKSFRPQFDEVYQRHPDIGEIGERMLRGGVEEVLQLDVEVGVPVLPALCDRLKTAQEMIKKMGRVFVEPKYDGTRVQIHWDAKSGLLKTFTRNLEENTGMFPELKGLLRDLKADSVILDCEAIGYHPETNELMVFQQTIKRKRKHGIEEAMAEIPLRFYVFDVLYVDGEPVLRRPLTERKEILQRILPAPATDLLASPYIVTESPEELRDFHAEQLAQGFEGAVIKRAEGVYQPGRQAFSWVKFKESEGSTAKLTDTIDAVVVGYYYGRGKRTAFGVGAFLVAIRDEAQGKLLTIAKIGTGLSDAQWRELKERADALLREYGELERKPRSFEDYELVVPEMLSPDVSLPLRLVVEVAADEITQSPLHTARVALRFPRLVRFRDDKSVEEITTLDELKEIRVSTQ